MLAYEDNRRFHLDIDARLPQYRAWFEEASEQTGVDWRLLAAIGYQESKWDPEAQSPMGALGLMMLTSNTADSLGVEDRSDAHESILAGARYFQTVRDKIPAHIPEPDRTGLPSLPTTWASGMLRMPVDWRKCAARIRIPGRTCASSCRCWRMRPGPTISNTASRAAPNPRNLSIASSAS